MYMRVSRKSYLDPGLPIIEDSGSIGDRIARNTLTILLLSGWIVASAGELGLTIWPAIILVFILFFFFVSRVFADAEPSIKDIRWLFVPILTVILGWIDPLWSTPMQWDQADHLQSANRYLGRWEWEPFHQGQDFAFRPKIMSGLLAIELGITGNSFEAFFIPFVCIVACGWQVQALAERNESLVGGILASLIVMTLPAMIVYGRTAYLEALATGGLILVLRIFLDVLEKGEFGKKDWLYLGAISSLVGAVKYPYLYLGATIPLAILIRERQMAGARNLVLSWMVIQSPFMISDFLFQNHPFASLEIQASGALYSAVGEYGTYGIDHTISDLMGELGGTLLVSLVFLAVLWIKIDVHSRALAISSVILPGTIIFSAILDFGYPRYHLPWLSAIICISCNWLSEEIDSFRMKARYDSRAIVSIVVLILISQQTHAVLSNSLQNKEYNQGIIEYRDSYLDEFMEFQDAIPEDAVVLTGFDITLGVRFGVPTYRFGPSDDPIHDSIQVVDATHVVIGGRATRFNWESDALSILGAPLNHIADSSESVNYATLWGVNDSRLSSHDDASKLDLEWGMRHVGDFILVPAGMRVIAPDGWQILLVIDLNNEQSQGEEAIDLIFERETVASIICRSPYCTEEFIVPEDTRYLVQVGEFNER